MYIICAPPVCSDVLSTIIKPCLSDEAKVPRTVVLIPVYKMPYMTHEKLHTRARTKSSFEKELCMISMTAFYRKRFSEIDLVRKVLGMASFSFELQLKPLTTFRVALHKYVAARVIIANLPRDRRW